MSTCPEKEDGANVLVCADHRITTSIGECRHASQLTRDVGPRQIGLEVENKYKLLTIKTESNNSYNTLNTHAKNCISISII